MSTALGRQNINGALLDNVREAGLALTSGTVLATASPVTGTDQQVAAPCTLWVMCKLSSGSGSLLVDNFVPGASHTFGSPAMTLTLSGTSYVSNRLDLSGTSLGFAVRLTTSANMVISDLELLVLNQLHQGQGWFDATSAQNAVVSANTGDDPSNQLIGATWTPGSGILSLGAVADNRFGV